MANRAHERVVEFPTQRIVRAAQDGATFSDVVKGRLRRLVGQCINRLGLPGSIQVMEFEDVAVGRHVSVAIDDLFVCLKIDGRDYYFDRISGKFDGTGTSA